jgi:hypothetical protein
MRIVPHACAHCGSTHRVLIRGNDVCLGCGEVDYYSPVTMANFTSPEEAKILQFRRRD